MISETGVRIGAGCRSLARCAAAALASALLALAAGAQQASPQPDPNRKPAWLPRMLEPYRSRAISETPLRDPIDLGALVRDGKIEISLELLRRAILRNNLEVESARFNSSLADTDILRARGGGAPRGAPGVRIPSGLFAGALGAGVGEATTVGGVGGAGGITGSARQVFARPRGTYDPSLAVNFSFDRTRSPLNTLVVAGVPNVVTATTALQARYAQAFTSGTSVSVSFNNQRQRSTQQFLRFNPAFVSSFSFVATQQLLNGFGFDVNRRFQTVAENGKRITQEAFRQQVSTTLSQAESLYWDLVAARDNVRVAENALAVARQLYEDNRQREEIGTLSGIEVVTAASEVSARQRDLVAARTVFEQREADLKNMLTRNLAGPLAEARIEPTDPLPEPKAEDVPAMAEAQTEASRNRPELRQAEANMVNQEVALRYTRNLLKPSLVAFVQFNSAGLYGDRLVYVGMGQERIFPGGISQAMRQVRSFSYPEYAFGFSLQIPIRNRSAQADSLRARIEIRQAETSLAQTRTRVALEVRNAVVALVQSKAQIGSAAKATLLRRENLSAEQEKLLTGLSTPYEVIRRQRDLVRAEFEEVRARTGYARALVELNRATGRVPEP